MKRRFLPAFMFVVLVILTGVTSLAVLLGSGSAATPVPTVEPTATAVSFLDVSLPGRGESRVGITISTEEVIGAVIRGPDGARIICYPDVTDCPTMQKVLQTVTPLPTIPPTNTPKPSATSMPTVTATLTPTHLPATAIQPTATLEQVQLTPTPTGEPKTCELKTNRGLNKRAGPGTSFKIIGSVAQGSAVQVQAFAQDASYVWANDATGWIAVRSLVAFDWWADGTDRSDVCIDVPGWPVNLVPPLPITRVPALGIHGTPGANGGEMLSAFAVLKAAGVPFGVKAVNEPALCRDTVAAGGICIYRSILPASCPDVTNPDPKAEALIYLSRLAPWINQDTHASYVEITNECDLSAERLDWWNQFLLEAVRLARDWRWPPLVAPTWAPGQPIAEWHLQRLRPALVALHDSGGALGVHNYSIYKDIGLCESDQWLGYRHRRVHAKLVEMGLGNLPLAITEAARGGGELLPSISDFDCWYKNIRADSYVLIAALWTAGPTSAWPDANLNGWMLLIARAVVG